MNTISHSMKLLILLLKNISMILSDLLTSKDIGYRIRRGRRKFRDSFYK